MSTVVFTRGQCDYMGCAITGLYYDPDTGSLRCEKHATGNHGHVKTGKRAPKFNETILSPEQIDNFNQVMRDEGDFFWARFSSTNIHITVYLSAISTHYFSSEDLSQPQGQLTLTSASGTNDRYQSVHFLGTASNC